MNILLVNPKIPTTFWSFHNALKFISKKSSEPPLGLLTVAALLPDSWHKRLVDMNIEPLTDAHISNADYVFLGGMHVQKKSFVEIAQRCKELNTPVVAGGPMVTMEYQSFLFIDHLILNEAEITLPQFLKDLKEGKPKQIYSSSLFPDLSLTPQPMWNLLDMKHYAQMSIQYSRGCPYNCDFCSITLLNGRKPRTKPKNQFINELESLFKSGWRGRVFVVDDNFIGNKRKLKSEILPALIHWSKQKSRPFNYITEVSINIADDQELMNMMGQAGFDATFIGIESPNDESLQECNKAQNQGRDMVHAVKKLQNNGFIVSGGFIVGFDKDPQNIFEQQISFIQKSGIVTAMVGLLNAQPGTKLFKRLKSENRIIKDFNGDNMDGSTNFIPKMNYDHLITGYRKILESIYSPKAYYERIKIFLKEFKFPNKASITFSTEQIKTLLKTFWILGIVEKGRRYFWPLVLFTLFRYPRKLKIAITMAVYGFHFRKVVNIA